MNRFAGRRFVWDRDQILAMRARGWGCTRIGNELGCDHSTVRYAMKKLGIETTILPPLDGGIRRTNWDDLAGMAGAIG